MSTIPSTPAPRVANNQAHSVTGKASGNTKTGEKNHVQVDHSQYEQSTSHRRLPRARVMLAGLNLPGVGGVAVGATGRGQSTVSANIHLLDTGGRLKQAVSFEESQAAAAANGYTFTKTMNSNKFDIAEGLARAGRGDIAVTYGHNRVGPSGKVLGIVTSAGVFNWGVAKMDGKEMKEAVADSDPAGVVVLGACKTTPLLQSLIAGGVKVAFGFSEEIAGGVLASAADVVVAALIRGATIQEAANAGNKILRGNLFNPDGAEIVFRLGAGVNANKSLLSQGIF